jgi:hypothetical protein
MMEIDSLFLSVLAAPVHMQEPPSLIVKSLEKDLVSVGYHEVADCSFGGVGRNNNRLSNRTSERPSKTFVGSTERKHEQGLFTT